MKKWPAQRSAAIAIGLLLLLLVRSLAEYRRLNGLYGRQIALFKFEPFISGCLVAAFSAGVAFALYVWHKYKIAVAVCAITIVGLIIYKIVVIV